MNENGKDENQSNLRKKLFENNIEIDHLIKELENKNNELLKKKLGKPKVNRKKLI